MHQKKRRIKIDPVFVVSAGLALASSFLVSPSLAYLSYIDWPVIILLYCLMAVVAGLKQTGLFEWLSGLILSKTGKLRNISCLLVLLCFFSAMVITNDVALLTFVPLTIPLLKDRGEDRLIFVIVMETVAANLGSMVTPIGNPQNLYLFTAYRMTAASFFRLTLPLGLISLILIILVMPTLRGHEAELPARPATEPPDPVQVRKYLILLVLCLLTVFKLVNYWLCLGIILFLLLLTDKAVLLKVDYVLLATFISFFIFVGNLSALPSLRTFVSGLMKGREMLAAALVSQFISNVPAAVMLSTFTDNREALLIGVNIGGLGTLIASLASLISYKLYADSIGAQKGRYLAFFSLINFIFLAALAGIAQFLGGNF